MFLSKPCLRERIERVNERAKAEGKRAVRKDAVVMADVVVTLPENVREGDEGAFFGWTYCFLADRLGSGNMLGGFVHRDEVRTDGSPVRDHMHAAFTPILDGRFNFKKMCPRTFYQSLHKDLGDYLEQHLGYRPEIELEDGKRAPISNAKDAMESHQDYSRRWKDSGDWRKEAIAKIYTRYVHRLAEANALDFDDIILHAVTLLQQEGEVRDYYRRKFRYVLIDEYQDWKRICRMLFTPK